MPITEKMDRIKAEYKILNKITKPLKLKNIPENMRDHNLRVIVNELHRRKELLKEIIEYDYSKGENFIVENMESRLKDSERFFSTITSDSRNEIEKFFENQPESIAKSEQWQAYHMAFVSLSDIGLVYEAEERYVRFNELKKQKAEIEKITKETTDFIKDLEERNPGINVLKLTEQIPTAKKEVEDADIALKEVENVLFPAKRELEIQETYLETQGKSLSDNEEELNKATKDLSVLKNAWELLNNNEEAIRKASEKTLKLREESNQVHDERMRVEKILYKKDDFYLSGLEAEHLKLFETEDGRKLKEYETYQKNYKAVSELKPEIMELLENKAEVSVYNGLKNSSSVSSEIKGQFRLYSLIGYGLFPKEKVDEMLTVKRKKDANGKFVTETATFDEFKEFILKGFEDFEKNHQATSQKLYERIPAEFHQKLKETHEKWQTEIQERKKIIEINERCYERINTIDEELTVAKEEYSKVLDGIFKGETKEVLPKKMQSFDFMKEQLQNKISEMEGKVRKYQESVNVLKEKRNETLEKIGPLKIDYEDKLKKQVEAKDILWEKNAKLRRIEELANNNELKTRKKNYNDAYKEAFGSSIRIKKPIEKNEMLDAIIAQAETLYKKKDSYMGKHENSVEFDAMISAFGEFIEKAKKPDANIEELCKNMSEKATTYRELKDKQYRPFPSAMRVLRLNLADTIKNIGDKYKANLDSIKEYTGFKEVEKYYEDNYKKFNQVLSSKTVNTEVKKEEVKNTVNKETVKKPEVKATNPKPAEIKGKFNFDVLKDPQALSKDLGMLKVLKNMNEFANRVIEDEALQELTYEELDSKLQNLIPVDFLVEEFKIETKYELNNLNAIDIFQHIDDLYDKKVYEQALKLAQKPEQHKTQNKEVKAPEISGPSI